MSVGNKEMDNQHKKILLLFQQAIKYVDNQRSPSVKFHELINDIVDVVREHFKLEEMLLAQNHCPDPELDRHSEEHIKITEIIISILYEAMQGRLDKHDLGSLLSECFNHIIQTDIPDKAFLQY